MAKGQLEKVLSHLRGVLIPRPEDAPSDGQLLERFARCREEASFAALVRRHGGLVLGVCRRVLADVHDAEDAFQATFLVLARKAGSIQKRESVASWLYGVAFRVASRAKADTARRRAREQEVEPLPPCDPLAELVWRELRPILDEELNRLPEKYRAPVVLCYLQGITHAEAARRLGWPRGTVAGRLARARQMLRARLTRRGLGLPAGLLAAALAESASAAVPTGLGMSTVKAAVLTAAGQAAAGLVSAAAAALVEGVLHAMLMGKLKIVTAVVLTFVVLGSGATWFAYGGLALSVSESQTEKATGDADEVAKLKAEIARLKKELARVKRQLVNVKREALAQADRALAERELARAKAEEAARLAERARKLELDALRKAEAARRKAIQEQKDAQRIKELETARLRDAVDQALKEAADKRAREVKKAEEAYQRAVKAAKALREADRKKKEAERKKKEEQ
jgi:RNA polymerase sigma factor (sigma-70 family)